MSLKDLVSLASAGAPGLDVAISVFTATYASVENVKLYKEQCRDITRQCVKLTIALHESSVGLEGHKAVELADEINIVIERVNKKVTEWGALGRLRSVLQQREIKDGLDRLNRDLNAAMMKFNIQLNMEHTRTQLETRAMQERNRAEFRELLEHIVQNNDDMKLLLSMTAPKTSLQPVQEVMGSLQNELRDSVLEPEQEQNFREGLWKLHQETSLLPPLEDLSGQVTMDHNRIVAKGTFNDIYMGLWLDKEPVALRAPRSLANAPDVQKRFRREVAIWRGLTHKNVVPLYGTVHFGKDVYTVSPWMDNGTAIDYVQKYVSTDKLRILNEVAEGLEYLHSNAVVHGDLRGSNVLIDKEGTPRLADFGLSKFLEDCGRGMTSSPGLNPRWLAPELIDSSTPLSTHSDVWSFGMLALEILTGEQPYSNISRDISVLKVLDKCKTPERPGPTVTASGLSDSLWTLMNQCWNKKPGFRPPMTTVKIKLQELRGLAPATPRQTRRTPSILSWKRPSSSGKSNQSSPKMQHMPTLSTNFVHSADDPQLSPISIRVSNGGAYLRSSPSISSKLSYDSGMSRSPELQEASGSALQPALDIAHHRRSSNPSLENSYPDSEYSTLVEVPFSTSLPKSFGSHLMALAAHSSPPSSSDHHPSPGFASSPVQDFSELREAAANLEPILNLDKDGHVVSGTLEGLVKRLISNSNLTSDLEFRDTLLISCVDFTEPVNLFTIIARRFHEAEHDRSMHTAVRVEIQHNIFILTKYWLCNHNLPMDPVLLGQIRDFCLSALAVKRSATMNDKIKDILVAIDERSDAGTEPSILLSPGRKVPKTSDILPRDLAIAMTLLEGDRYKSILPTDYLLHLGSLSIPTRVDSASTINNKIVVWVKQSILYYDNLESRAEVLKFFINTAQECRKFRNFSSVTAIASALQSTSIERLARTKDRLPQALRATLDSLVNLVSPTNNHKAYRKALHEILDPEYSEVCIPWLAVHLKQLHAVLVNYPRVIQIDGRSLIHFEHYNKFVSRMKEILHYKAPQLEHYRGQGQLAYLERQLRDIHVDAVVDDQLLKRSKALQTDENRDFEKRTTELRSLGFKT